MLCELLEKWDATDVDGSLIAHMSTLDNTANPEPLLMLRKAVDVTEHSVLAMMWSPERIVATVDNGWEEVSQKQLFMRLRRSNADWVRHRNDIKNPVIS